MRTETKWLRKKLYLLGIRVYQNLFWINIFEFENQTKISKTYFKTCMNLFENKLLFYFVSKYTQEEKYPKTIAEAFNIQGSWNLPVSAMAQNPSHVQGECFGIVTWKRKKRRDACRGLAVVHLLVTFFTGMAIHTRFWKLMKISLYLFLKRII